MADRFPLILNTSANQIQEIASGDSLDLTGSNITNAGIITANNVTIGAATTDLIVNGDARITGILTIGTGSLTLDGSNNLVNVGTALTLGHTQGLQFHTQNLHSAGFEVNQINVSGASTMGGDVTFTGDNYNVLWDKSQNQLEFADNAKALFGTDGDLFVFHNGSNSYVQDAGQGILFLDSSETNITKFGSNHNMAKFIGGGAVELYHNNTKRFETTTSGVTITGDGTFTGNVSIGGTLTYEDVTNIDSVGIITARSGINLIGGNITLGDTSDGSSDDLLIFGAGSDLKIYHDSNHSYIQNATGDLFIKSNADDLVLQAADDILIRPQNGEDGIKVIGNGAVEIYHDGTKMLETTSIGLTISGDVKIIDNENLRLGNDNDMLLYHTGSHGYIENATGNMYIRGGGGQILMRANSSEDAVVIKPDGSVELYYNNTKHFETVSAGLNFAGSNADQLQWQKSNNLLKFRDGTKAVFGEGDDFKIEHNTNENYIDSNSGHIYIRANVNDDEGDNIYIQPKSGENSAVFIHDGAVELYHNGTKRLETFDNSPYVGVSVTNDLILNGAGDTAIRWAVGGYGGSNYKWGMYYANSDGHLRIFDNVNSRAVAVWKNTGAIELNYAASKKFETTSSGVNVTGQLVADNGLKVPDGKHITLGTDNDFRFYHDGSNAAWNNTTGNNYLYGGGGHFYIRPVNAEQGINVHANGNVELFHDNVERLETTSTGVSLLGGDHNATGTFEVNDGVDGDCFRALNGGATKWCLGTTGTTGNATVSMDARTYGTRARLHKWTSPNRDGGSYGNYSESWYDGGAYRVITALTIGFAFDHHVLPGANNTYDLGTSSLRWRNIYTNDLNLSNEGGKNEVDGTWGNYTIQEGENDLFLINKRSGKKYKFNLTEVS